MLPQRSVLPFLFVLCPFCHQSVVGSGSSASNNAKRFGDFHGTGKEGKQNQNVRAWQALYQLDYDIVLAVTVVVVIFLIWMRSMYLHYTVKSVPDKYKPKYH